ncbi:hypothetical protein H072_10249 [Dactylellina haptotyla CBS 200.50]|uniref:Uncharacterized protein n=1 Tax=Dactylellina haptotyla (strain CBS 200.50) TaxID=1284197 RepID=S8A4Z6_DACHA|nr:hypothetical protein H072_10249 [Dactylellina haptotyla CBS 200.50]
MRGGQIIKYTLFYWKDHNQREPMKFDITNCPFLDEPLFTEAPPVWKPETRECGDHGSGGVARKVEKRMKFRIGAVACKPILRGFFWDGEKQEKKDAITVRQAVEEIAKNLKREIESSKLLSDLGLASGQRKIKFRPIGRWTLADSPGKGMDAVRENISVSETSVRFKERSLQYGVATRGRFY